VIYQRSSIVGLGLVYRTPGDSRPPLPRSWFLVYKILGRDSGDVS
jgi:hypothetical protein